jgi:hypothetical protein
MALPDELSPQVLSGLFTKFREAPAKTLLRQFFPALPNTAQGAHLMWDVYEYSRGMAPLVGRFAPAPRTNMPVRSRVAVDAITMKESLEPDLATMLDGTAPGTLTGPAREAAIAAALVQIYNRQANRLEWLTAQWLTGGACLSSAGVAVVEPSGTIYLDYGQVTNSGPLAISSGLSATHVDAGVTASWKTAGTDIFADLESARVTILQDSGVDATTVLMNSKTYRATFGKNTAAIQAETTKSQIAQYGYMRELWGWTIQLYDGIWFPETDTTAETASTAHQLIPDDVAIILSPDNARSGRALVECNPSDADAPAGHRGVYGWQDKAVEHPHNTTYGVEWTGLPVFMNPDSMYIYTNIADTS